MPDPLDVPFPLGGIDVSTPADEQRPLTTPSAANVRANDPILDRARGGSRPGLVKGPTGQIPSGSHLIQCLGQVVLDDPDFMLTNFEDYGTDFVPDVTYPDLSIPPGGSGFVPVPGFPRDPRRRVSLAVVIS